MSDADVARTVSRIAHQIIEKTALDGPPDAPPRVILLGIPPTRGVTLANRLAAKIHEFAGVTVERGGLDITLYRDDLDFKPPPRALEETSIPAGGIDGALVILVDDVLYTGRRCAPRSTRCATSAGPRWCNWRSSSTAATASCRCGRLRRKERTHSRSENVKVRLIEDDGVEGIWIAPQGGPAR